MQEIIYRTRDLQLAATLQCLGHKIIRLQDHPTKPGTKQFVFEDVPNKEGYTPSYDASRYLKKELRVEPTNLFYNNTNLREWVKPR